MIATVLAIIFANSPLHFIYDFILDTPLEVRLGRHIHIGKPLMLRVSALVLPIFAFANAGIPLSGMGISDLFQPVPLGIMLGLTVGKLIGVYGFSVAAMQLPN